MKIFFVILLLIILGGLYVYQNFYSDVSIDPNPEPQVLQVGDNAILVANQRPGNSVIIGFATLSRSGYVVILENEEGSFGTILGNSKIIEKGESLNVPIGLTRSVMDGESLFAVLYEDSGDGTFSPDLDAPIKDDAGNVIFMRFIVDQNADRIEDIQIK